MARVKRGVAAHKRHKRLLAQASGRRGTRSTLVRPAREALFHALVYAYRDRKNRKRDMRRLWIERINAASRQHGVPYGRFIAGLHLHLGAIQTFLVLGGQRFLQPLFDGVFRQRPGEFIDHLTVHKQLHRRNAANTVAARDFGILIRVDLDQAPGPAALAGEFVERRAEHPARTAPGGPEIHEHRLTVARLDDVLLEGGSIGHGRFRVLRIGCAGWLRQNSLPTFCQRMKAPITRRNTAKPRCRRACDTRPAIRLPTKQRAELLRCVRLIETGDRRWTLAGGNIRPDMADTLAALQAQGGAYTLETVTPAGVRSYERIASISRVLPFDPTLAALVELGADSRTRIISFTVTEAGYYLDGSHRLDLGFDELAAGGRELSYEQVLDDLARRDLRDTARPILRSLVGEISEAASLGVLQSDLQSCACPGRSPGQAYFRWSGDCTACVRGLTGLTGAAGPSAGEPRGGLGRSR